MNTAGVLNLALLDDHPAVLAGLRRLIDPEPDLAVIAAARSADDLARRLDGGRVDVMVLDYDLTRGDGLSLCRRLKDRSEPPRVIVYSAYASPALALAARAAAADGVVDKSEPVSVLLAAIRAVARGESHFPTVPPDAYQAAATRLDDQDLPVLALLLDGEPQRRDRRRVAHRPQRDRLAPTADRRPAAPEAQTRTDRAQPEARTRPDTARAVVVGAFRVHGRARDGLSNAGAHSRRRTRPQFEPTSTHSKFPTTS
jgi:DNA-binding NarL/FixJ family response regulator